MSIHILIADDCSLSRSLLGAMLSKSGIAWVAAADGEEALDRLADHPWLTLALVDIQMPRRDGLATAREARRRWPERPLALYALSAEAVGDAPERFRDAGFDGHFAKPIAFDALIALAKRHVPAEASPPPAAAANR